MLHLFEHETVMDGDQGAAPAAEPVVEPASQAAEPATAAEPEPFDAEAAFGRLQSQYEEISSVLPYLMQQPHTAAAEQPQPQAGEEEFDFDPFDPDSFRQGITSIFQEQVRPLQEALAPIIQAQNAAASEAFMAEQLESLNVPADPIGETEISQRDLVGYIAGGLRYAYPDIDPALALRAANQIISPVIAAVEARGRQGQVEELEQVRTATQPVSGQGATVVAGQPRARTLTESAERAATRLGITP
jgi:hypothetical protein